MEENGINYVYILLLTISFSSFLSLGTQLTKAYVAKTSWYRLYYENKGLLNIHTEDEARGLLYSMNPSSKCISGLYSTFWVGCPYQMAVTFSIPNSIGGWCTGDSGYVAKAGNPDHRRVLI